MQFRVLYDFSADPIYGSYKILVIGGRELFLSSKQKNPKENRSKAFLIPYLSKKNDIIGTQLILSGENTGRREQVFIFENEVEQQGSMPSSVLIEFQGFKLYRSETDGSIIAVMAFVQLSHCVFH